MIWFWFFDTQLKIALFSELDETNNCFSMITQVIIRATAFSLKETFTVVTNCREIIENIILT